jgi:hypothetical protein
VALAVAGPLAEALVIPAETLAAGVAAGGAAAAVPAARAATGVAAGGAAGSRGAAAVRGPPVVPAGAAGVVGAAATRAGVGDGGRGVATAIAERGGSYAGAVWRPW